MENTVVSVTMCATVCQVCCCSLLVCDHETCQQVLVHSDNARCFSVGDRVCIHYSGAMSMSMPPQITAESICHLRRC